MDEELIRDLVDLAQGGNDALKISGIPKDNCDDEEIQARGAVLLVFVGAITACTQSMDEDRPARLLGVSPLLSSQLLSRRSSGSSNHGP